jgi:hypothetical protein
MNWRIALAALMIVAGVRGACQAQEIANEVEIIPVESSGGSPYHVSNYPVSGGVVYEGLPNAGCSTCSPGVVRHKHHGSQPRPPLLRRLLEWATYFPGHTPPNSCNCHCTGTRMPPLHEYFLYDHPGCGGYQRGPAPGSCSSCQPGYGH